MLRRRCHHAARQLIQHPRRLISTTTTTPPRLSILSSLTTRPLQTHLRLPPRTTTTNYFSTTCPRPAQSPTADSIMETLNDLYATAKDEFEIAAEETEKQTVYAEDDRQACREAFGELQGAFERAVRECSPEVAKEVQGRTGPRIRELENAIKNMEEMAVEH